MKKALNTSVQFLNTSFNQLSVKHRKLLLLGFGISTASLCLMMILKGVSGNSDDHILSIKKITRPKDIYMSKKNKNDADHLIPVGKYKGEINGGFEAFYLAVDSVGNTYINRSPDYTKDMYLKSNGWKEISKQELSEYKKHLHFIPKRKNGLKP